MLTPENFTFSEVRVRGISTVCDVSPGALFPARCKFLAHRLERENSETRNEHAGLGDAGSVLQWNSRIGSLRKNSNL